MSITGNLRTLEFEELLQWLAQGRKTGTLTIANGTVQKSISLKNGRIIASASSDPRERLGSFLVDQGYIDDSTLEHALKLQEATQISVGKVLVSLGSMSESDLGRLLRKKTEESIYDLFFWPEGEFEFQQEEPARLAMVPLSLDVTQVLLEGMRRLDEWKAGNGAEPDPVFERAAERYQEAGAKTVAIEPPPLPSPVETAEESGEVVGQVGLAEVDEDAGQASPLAPAKSQKTVFTSVAAGVLALAGLGWAWVSLRASEPTPALAESSGSGRRLVEVAPRLDPVSERLAAVPAASEPESSLALSDVVPPGTSVADPRDAGREEALKARYEEELTTLRQELAETRRRAAEERKALEERRLAEEGTPTGEAVAQEESQEFPVADPNAAAADLVASDPTSASASGLSVGSPAAQPGPVAERPRSPEEAADSATQAPPPSAQPEVRKIEKASPPPPPRKPRTRVGDLVTAGPGVVPPQLTRPPSPRYPLAAQRMGRSGKVRVRVLVDENGSPIEVRQVGPEVGMGFDKAALKAAQAAVWKPATKDGVRVKMWFDLVIQFEP